MAHCTDGSLEGLEGGDVIVVHLHGSWAEWEVAAVLQLAPGVLRIWREGEVPCVLGMEDVALPPCHGTAGKGIASVTL